MISRNSKRVFIANSEGKLTEWYMDVRRVWSSMDDHVWIYRDNYKPKKLEIPEGGRAVIQDNSDGLLNKPHGLYIWLQGYDGMIDSPSREVNDFSERLKEWNKKNVVIGTLDAGWIAIGEITAAKIACKTITSKKVKRQNFLSRILKRNSL